MLFRRDALQCVSTVIKCKKNPIGQKIKEISE